MTDHAKALADALDDVLAYIPPGYDKLERACEAIIADYRASHPAEAATRENGDLRETVARALHEFERVLPGGGRRSPVWANQLPEFREHMRRKADAAIAALSTHQQQGGGYAQGFYDGWMRCGCFHIDMNFEGREEEKANIAARVALSRAPQPDTVTEDK